LVGNISNHKTMIQLLVLNPHVYVYELIQSKGLKNLLNPNTILCLECYN